MGGPFPEFKLGLGQLLVEGGKVEENLLRAEEMVKAGAQEGCRAIVLPECLDTGWTDPGACKLARPIPGETSDRLCQVAKANKVMIVAGLTELDGSRIYNSAVLVDETGKILLKHRKINVLKIAQDLYGIGNSSPSQRLGSAS